MNGSRSTQVRGGTGVFTGPPGLRLDLQPGRQHRRADRLRAGPQHEGAAVQPQPDAYKPTNVTGAPASSYELALTDPDFKFPQVWRTNLAVDQEAALGPDRHRSSCIYSSDVNGISYINANLPAAQTNFSGADNRPRWTTQPASTPTSPNADGAGEPERGLLLARRRRRSRSSYRAGFLKAAYSYGQSKNTVDPGSIAFGSWTGNTISGDPNNPGVAYSNQSPGHRVFVAGSYRLEYFKFGATTFSFFWRATGTATPATPSPAT